MILILFMIVTILLSGCSADRKEELNDNNNQAQQEQVCEWTHQGVVY